MTMFGAGGDDPTLGGDALEIARWTQAIRRSPSDPANFFQRGLVFKRMNDAYKARKILRRHCVSIPSSLR